MRIIEHIKLLKDYSKTDTFIKLWPKCSPKAFATYSNIPVTLHKLLKNFATEVSLLIIVDIMHTHPV